MPQPNRDNCRRYRENARRTAADDPAAFRGSLGLGYLRDIEHMLRSEVPVDRDWILRYPE